MKVAATFTQDDTCRKKCPRLPSVAQDQQKSSLPLPHLLAFPSSHEDNNDPSRLALATESDEPGKLPKTLLQLFLPVDDDTAP